MRYVDVCEHVSVKTGENQCKLVEDKVLWGVSMSHCPFCEF